MAKGKKTGGRAKGTPNKIPGAPRVRRRSTAASTSASTSTPAPDAIPLVVPANHVRDVCRAMVDDPKYRTKLAARLLAGKIAPAVETMIWHYAYGKPVETVALTGEGGGPIKHHVRITIVKKDAA